MGALKQRLKKEPAFPNGAPPRQAIMGAGQIATQAGYPCPEGAHHHGLLITGYSGLCSTFDTAGEPLSAPRIGKR